MKNTRVNPYSYFIIRFCSIVLAVTLFVSCKNRDNRVEVYGKEFNGFRKRNNITELPNGYVARWFSDDCLTFRPKEYVANGKMLTMKLVFFDKEDKWYGEETHIADFVNGKTISMQITVDSLANDGLHKRVSYQ